jgi:hypothetical protein
VLRQEIGVRASGSVRSQALSFVPGADAKTGQSLSGGKRIPGGYKSFVPGGDGDPFSLGGEKIPGRTGHPGRTSHRRWDKFANENLSQLNASCRNDLGGRVRGTGHFRGIAAPGMVPIP